ncbi:biotin transporter BioY [Rhizohabitans arisaemae]|uniref:biotin transporter BioY n=1 Tax=Rhizohabitans arisaemae TaxID=2720610 RepID=UPI0024B13225|nr:biotin transporter BioY [Rhizohabitans arisaemae]
MANTQTVPVLSDLVPGKLVRDVGLVVGAAVLTGISAQLTFPIPGTVVPFSFQTLVVLLSGAALGFHRAALSMVLYLAAGVAGVPWFAGGNSGWAVPTLGYVFGFLLAAVVVGALARRGGDRTVVRTVVTMALGTLLIYAVGVPWLMSSTGMDLSTALAKGVVPFLIGDGIKIALAAGLLPAAWKLAGGRGKLER